MASVRACEKLPQCPTEPVASKVASKVYVPLAKAGSIRNCGNASMITDLRKKNHPMFVQF